LIFCRFIYSLYIFKFPLCARNLLLNIFNLRILIPMFFRLHLLTLIRIKTRVRFFLPIYFLFLALRDFGSFFDKSKIEVVFSLIMMLWKWYAFNTQVIRKILHVLAILRLTAFIILIHFTIFHHEIWVALTVKLLDLSNFM
jgi:hypothetical protein